MLNKIDTEIIKSENDVLEMLDTLLENRESEWWDKFYTNKEKPIPFFKNIPDENLVSYFSKGYLSKGKALDIGCGNGRNSIYLAQRGYHTIGLDFSTTSIEWARKMARENDVNVKFLCESIFEFKSGDELFDFIYDSGCLHHIKPHRRSQYLQIVAKNLNPEGYFGMVCFNLEGGSNLSDYDVYKGNSMCGGLGFSEFKLKTILEPYFEIVELRNMIQSDDEKVFGIPILWTVLMKKRINEVR